MHDLNCVLRYEAFSSIFVYGRSENHMIKNLKDVFTFLINAYILNIQLHFQVISALVKVFTQMIEKFKI